jgi:drug/metabolite transporter (DMT)-like permease
LATVGVLLIIGVGNLEFSGMLGGSALLVAALTWALMSVLVKRVPNEYSQIAVIAYSILVALLLLTPFVLPRLPELDMTQLAQPTIWGGLLYLGIASTAGGFLLWNRGLQLLDVSGGGLLSAIAYV